MVVRLSDGAVLRGELPVTGMRMVQQWALAHRGELEDNWRRMQAGESPEKIVGPMDASEFPWVDALKVRGLAGHRLWARFSDGCEGTLDPSEYIRTGGPMIEPLRDQAYFERVFVEMGVPIWPNHFDMDATNLYIEMRKAGTLIDTAAAAE